MENVHTDRRGKQPRLQPGLLSGLQANTIYLTIHCRVCNVTPFAFDCNK